MNKKPQIKVLSCAEQKHCDHDFYRLNKYWPGFVSIEDEGGGRTGEATNHEHHNWDYICIKCGIKAKEPDQTQELNQYLKQYLKIAVKKEYTDYYQQLSIELWLDGEVISESIIDKTPKNKAPRPQIEG